MAQTVLITGASRGIGLGLVKVFSENGYKVIATCRYGNSFSLFNRKRHQNIIRNPATATALSETLKTHDQVGAVALDVTSDKSIQELKTYLETEGVTVNHLINNAGVAAKGKDLDENPSLSSIK